MGLTPRKEDISSGFTLLIILSITRRRYLLLLTLLLPSTSKNQYLSVKHVSRSPEY